MKSSPQHSFAMYMLWFSLWFIFFKPIQFFWTTLFELVWKNKTKNKIKP